MEKTRQDLKIMFRDGARPTGSDFTDVFDSFIHRSNDNFAFSDNGTQIGNFTLGNFTATPREGSMRYFNGDILFYNGSVWKSAGANDLGFLPLNQPPAAPLPDAVFFGRAGINLGTAPVALRDDFEVGPPNTITKARIGTAVMGGNGPGGARAMFFHSGVRALPANGGDPEKNYAFAQNAVGGVFINTVAGQGVQFSTNDAPNLLIQNGRLVVGSVVPLTPVPAPGDAIPIMLHVYGHAIKNDASTAWLVTSDVRTKKDIRDFRDGLDKLKALRTVNFQYNGRAGTQEGIEQVGLIGQEVEPIAPYLVKRLGNPVSTEGEQHFPEDMLLLDSSPLVYMLINAVKELDEKISQLKKLQEND